MIKIEKVCLPSCVNGNEVKWDGIFIGFVVFVYTFDVAWFYWWHFFVTVTDMIGKTKEFKVFNKRFQFKCPSCGGRRNYFVNNLRRKNITCFKCGENTRCLLNRRTDRRDYQSGKIVMTTRAGKEIEVNLKNLSFYGAGVEIPPGTSSSFLSVGQEVTLKCNWNSQLITYRRFVVQNINGQQVGVKKATR